MNILYKKTNNFSKGSSLIEVIIYVVIFGIFLSGIISFLITIDSSRIRSQTKLEVNYQGSNVISTITRVVRNSTGITNPSVSANSNSLVLQTSNLSTNPTTFYVSNGVLFMTEGSGTPVALTNSVVEVKSLVFYNLSNSGTPGSVKIELNLGNKASNVRANEQYSNTFYGSASIR
jgi:Tfp pilus assembly protein PilW